MEAHERRKTLGRRIMAARTAAGYRTQLIFAEAIGLSEGSVANAERGAERVGGKVFAIIETALGWPANCCETFIETGDLSVLPSSVGGQPSTSVSEAELERLAGLWSRVARMSYGDTQRLVRYIWDKSGEAEAKRALRLMLDIQEEAQRENQQREPEGVSDHK